MGALVSKFCGFLSRLFRQTRPERPTEDYLVDPIEFANLIKSGKRKDFEKLARLLSSHPAAQNQSANQKLGDDRHGINQP